MGCAPAQVYFNRLPESMAAYRQKQVLPLQEKAKTVLTTRTPSIQCSEVPDTVTLLPIAVLFGSLIQSILGGSPVTTIPVENPIALKHGWLDECEARVAAAQGKQIDLLFIGDSITQNFVEEPTPAWPLVGASVWKKHYAARSALNFGVGSDGTEHILWRMDHENIKTFKPRVVVLLAGANDLQYSADDIAAGIKAVLEKSRAMYPDAKVILMATLPNGRDMPKTVAANKITSTFADDRTVFYLDLAPWMPAAGDNFKGVGFDHIHLTPDGYEIWASHLDPLLDRLLAPQPR